MARHRREFATAPSWVRAAQASDSARPPREICGLMSFPRTLQLDIDTKSGLAALFARLGTNNAPRAFARTCVRREIPATRDPIALARVLH
jgi:hypothetical protein